jgi:hypothetical protein
VIDGKPLEKLGRRTRNVRTSLDMAAADISAGKPISQNAVDLMAKPMMSKWVYLFLDNIGRSFHALRKLVSWRHYARSLEEPC